MAHIKHIYLLFGSKYSNCFKKELDTYIANIYYCVAKCLISEKKMPQVHCYLNQKMADQLDKIKDDEGYESSSQAMKEMLSLGIKVYLINKENLPTDDTDKNRLDKEEELKNMHTMYLLRMLELNSDILRCVYDQNKLKNAPDNSSDHIIKIKQKVDDYIEEYINH